MQVLMTVRAKGVRGTVVRFGTILGRFGPTPARMEEYLRTYADAAQAFGGQPTLPITAVVLQRHQALIRRFSQRGVEFAIHGLVHNDHAVLGLERQVASMKKALQIFQRAGVPCAGFRGPYLRANAATDTAVREVGLQYHSSQAVAFPVVPAALRAGPNGHAYDLAIEFYGALDARRVAVRPRNRQGLIDIPVAVPDDEIMVDRLHLDTQQQVKAWLGILNWTHGRGELFTVQLHAERIPRMVEALRHVLRQAQALRPHVWTARLDEITAWWQRRRLGDIRVERCDAAGYRVQIEAPADATILVRGAPEVPSEPWYGLDRRVQSRSFELTTERKPVVGVSARSSESLRAFLVEEGFATEATADPTSCGAYIDLPAESFDEAEVLDALERAPGPLVRLWRWPDGARSALALTGDIDSITLQDFALRLWETRR